MTHHAGRNLALGSVRIGAPPADVLECVSAASDIASAVVDWFSAAQKRDDVYYFAIYREDQLVGQIVLHDIDWSQQESLVAYHLFEERVRGQGIGTDALSLLQNFVRDDTNLRRLIIITSDDNAASQHVAQKCGFIYTGASRENPVHGLVFVWEVPRRHSKTRSPRTC